MNEVIVAPESQSEKGQLIREHVPSISDKTLVLCVKHDLVGRRLTVAMGMVEVYGVKLHSIAKWLDRGMSLDRVQECLEIKDTHDLDSVAVVNDWLESSGLQIEADWLFEAVNDFIQAYCSDKPNRAWYGLLDFAEACLPGGVLELAARANDDPESLYKEYRASWKRKGVAR